VTECEWQLCLIPYAWRPAAVRSLLPRKLLTFKTCSTQRCVSIVLHTPSFVGMSLPSTTDAHVNTPSATCDSEQTSLLTTAHSADAAARASFVGICKVLTAQLMIMADDNVNVWEMAETAYVHARQHSVVDDAQDCLFEFMFIATSEREQHNLAVAFGLFAGMDVPNRSAMIQTLLPMFHP